MAGESWDPRSIHPFRASSRYKTFAVLPKQYSRDTIEKFVRKRNKVPHIHIAPVTRDKSRLNLHINHSTSAPLFPHNNLASSGFTVMLTVRCAPNLDSTSPAMNSSEFVAPIQAGANASPRQCLPKHEGQGHKTKCCSLVCCCARSVSCSAREARVSACSAGLRDHHSAAMRIAPVSHPQ